MTTSAQIPRWMQDFLRLSASRSQLLVHGAVKDYAYYPREPAAQAWELQHVRNAIIALLMHHVGGYDLIGSYDPVDGMVFADGGGAHAPSEMRQVFMELTREAARQAEASGVPQGQRSSGPLELVCRQLRVCLLNRQHPCAFVLEYVPQCTAGATALEQNDRLAYVQLLKTAGQSLPVALQDGGLRGWRRNLLVVICDKLTDLPTWLYLDNPFSASISVTAPDSGDRRLFLQRELMPCLTSTPGAAEAMSLDELADLTEGMSVRDLASIQELARESLLAAARATEPAEDGGPGPLWPTDAPRNAKALVDRYKYGPRESEWDNLSWHRLDAAEAELAKRVMGQPAAVAAVADVLRRARLHLSGVQHSSRSKPRGILFFAGPTGVGKTEMAKAIAELVFSSEDALLRFDMSEYGVEQADQRLLGAPPGYVGYEEGGQLTNAVREKPFSVLLFDEIEKAHPSILDKFLQILEDGRMTDGRGETVHFSETVIIFTSNAGIYKLDPRTRWPEVDATGRPVMLVDPHVDKEYVDVHAKVLEGVQAFFKTVLGRPELLNRIGQNIVVFDFVREPVMREILKSKVLRSISENVGERWRVFVEFADPVEDEIMEICSQDVGSGGRGVGNLAEVALVNPLARRLYELTSGACADGSADPFPLAGWKLVVKGIHPPGDSSDQRYALDVESRDAEGRRVE
jgi:DNA polymerase III delta prime subunit